MGGSVIREALRDTLNTVRAQQALTKVPRAQRGADKKAESKAGGGGPRAMAGRRIAPGTGALNRICRNITAKWHRFRGRGFAHSAGLRSVSASKRGQHFTNALLRFSKGASKIGDGDGESMVQRRRNIKSDAAGVAENMLSKAKEDDTFLKYIQNAPELAKMGIKALVSAGLEQFERGAPCPDQGRENIQFDGAMRAKKNFEAALKLAKKIGKDGINEVLIDEFCKAFKQALGGPERSNANSILKLVSGLLTPQAEGDPPSSPPEIETVSVGPSLEEFHQKLIEVLMSAGVEDLKDAASRYQEEMDQSALDQAAGEGLEFFTRAAKIAAEGGGAQLAEKAEKECLNAVDKLLEDPARFAAAKVLEATAAVFEARNKNAEHSPLLSRLYLRAASVAHSYAKDCGKDAVAVFDRCFNKAVSFAEGVDNLAPIKKPVDEGVDARSSVDGDVDNRPQALKELVKYIEILSSVVDALDTLKWNSSRDRWRDSANKDWGVYESLSRHLDNKNIILNRETEKIKPALDRAVEHLKHFGDEPENKEATADILAIWEAAHEYAEAGDVESKLSYREAFSEASKQRNKNYLAHYETAARLLTRGIADSKKTDFSVVTEVFKSTYAMAASRDGDGAAWRMVQYMIPERVGNFYLNAITAACNIKDLEKALALAEQGVAALENAYAPGEENRVTAIATATKRSETTASQNYKMLCRKRDELQSALLHRNDEIKESPAPAQ